MSNATSTATFGQMELDSHADTIVLGSNAEFFTPGFEKLPESST
jgi:hypothetical protein